MLRRVRNRLHRMFKAKTRHTVREASEQTVNDNSPVLAKILDDWVPIDEELYQSWLSLLAPTLRKPFSHEGKGCLSLIGQDLYQTPLFSEEGCLRLLSELEAFNVWANRFQVDITPPNSMHKYGLILSQLGFEPAMTELFEYLKPMLAPLFPDVGSASLDSHHGFIVSYSTKRGDTDLGFHVDNSEVTLNITLQTEGVGGELYFQGRRCEVHRQMPHRAKEEFVVRHETGSLIIHTGAHRHGVYPINDGSRTGIIMWLTSSSYRSQPSGVCESWCADAS